MQAKTLFFDVSGSSEVRMAFDVERMVNAGWVGRDKESLMAHIEELKEEGIPAPEEVPICFPILQDRITQDDTVEVLDESDHSGEAEYVLLFHKGSIYVAAGSDHTDRKVEISGVPKAKVFYPNVISREVWRLDDVCDHWDQLILRCWIKSAKGERVLYQEDALSSIIDWKSLIDFTKKHLVNPEDTEGMVVYSGTVPAKIKIQYSSSWEVELEDPKRGKKIGLAYQCVPSKNWFKH